MTLATSMTPETSATAATPPVVPRGRTQVLHPGDVMAGDIASSTSGSSSPEVFFDAIEDFSLPKTSQQGAEVGKGFAMTKEHCFAYGLSEKRESIKGERVTLNAEMNYCHDSLQGRPANDPTTVRENVTFIFSPVHGTSIRVAAPQEMHDRCTTSDTSATAARTQLLPPGDVMPRDIISSGGSSPEVFFEAIEDSSVPPLHAHTDIGEGVSDHHEVSRATQQRDEVRESSTQQERASPYGRNENRNQNNQAAMGADTISHNLVQEWRTVPQQDYINTFTSKCVGTSLQVLSDNTEGRARVYSEDAANERYKKNRRFTPKPEQSENEERPTSRGGRRLFLAQVFPAEKPWGSNLREETRRIVTMLNNDRAFKVPRPSLGLQDRLRALRQRQRPVGRRSTCPGLCGTFVRSVVAAGGGLHTRRLSNLEVVRCIKEPKPGPNSTIEGPNASTSSEETCKEDDSARTPVGEDTGAADAPIGTESGEEECSVRQHQEASSSSSSSRPATPNASDSIDAAEVAKNVGVESPGTPLLSEGLLGCSDGEACARTTTPGASRATGATTEHGTDSQSRAEATCVQDIARLRTSNLLARFRGTGPSFGRRNQPTPPSLKQQIPTPSCQRRIPPPPNTLRDNVDHSLQADGRSLTVGRVDGEGRPPSPNSDRRRPSLSAERKPKKANHSSSSAGHVSGRSSSRRGSSFGQDLLRKCLEEEEEEEAASAFVEDATEAAESRPSQEDLDASLSRAVRSLDTERTGALLHQGADPNVRCGRPSGPSALLRAAQQGALPLVLALVEAGADVDAADRSGVTPLQVALARGHPRVARALLRLGADASFPNRIGETAREMASRLGYGDLCGEEEEEEAVPAAVRLICGIESGCPATVKSCLSEGAPPDTVVPLALPHRPAGATALHRAAHHGHALISRLLLVAGARIDVRDAAGNTPLHAAAQAGHNRTAKVLLREGAPPEARSRSGMTPLHRAASKGRELTCGLLLQRGCDPRAEDKEGLTPADWARKRGFKALAKSLAHRRRSSASLMTEDAQRKHRLKEEEIEAADCPE